MGIWERLFGKKEASVQAERPPIPASKAGVTITTISPSGGKTSETLSREELRARVAENDARRAAEPPRVVEPPERIRVKKLDEANLKILDVTAIPATLYRIVGQMHSVSDASRKKLGASEYLLVREPRNKVDPNAVAVVSQGRRIGYISAAKAAAVSPILAELPYDALRVRGAGTTDHSIKMHVGIPSATALKKFVKDLPST
jgi:hypothetical protein